MSDRTQAPVDPDSERDGSHALFGIEGIDPFSVDVEGAYVGETVRYHHRVTIYWNERRQLQITVWNQSASVQGRCAKALTIAEAKELRNYLNRTIPQMEGHR